MMLSDDGVKLIQSFESYMEKLPGGSCKAYKCVVGRDSKGRPIYDGKLTIGWGCTEGVIEGMIWTREQADDAFRRELSAHEAAVNRLVKVSISQHAFDALVSFSYNVGSGALAGSTLLKKLNAGDILGAADQFRLWVNSNGVKNVPGLVRRRAEEKAMFLRPDPHPGPLPASGERQGEAASLAAMPQTIDKPAQVSSAVQSSRTIFGSLLAIFGAILAACKDFATEAVNQIGLLAPTREILSGLGVTSAKVALIVTLAGCLYALYARLDDARKGANVK